MPIDEAEKQRLAAQLMRRMDAIPDGPARDWYEALVHVALDETGGDLEQAMLRADAAYAATPAEPADDGSSSSSFTDPAAMDRHRRRKRRQLRRRALNVNALLLGASTFDDPPAGPAPSPIALHGADGARAEQLLKRAQDQGARVLAVLTRRAVARLVYRGPGAKPDALFSPTEQRRLGHALAATIGTAHLLGAARIRRRADQVEKHADPAQRFSDVPTDLRCFDETGAAGIEPMAPAAAAEYFRGLVPALNVEPAAFAEAIGRRAFTLAVTTDKTLLDKVQAIIDDRIATGERVRDAAGEVQAVLEAAGVAPANPQYSDMVVRTNLMENFNIGAQRELAGLADVFPVWRYSNPQDSRSRPEHADRDGKYWPAARHFTDVRGTDPGDVCNCRCTFIPVDRREWQELQSTGARTEDA